MYLGIGIVNGHLIEMISLSFNDIMIDMSKYSLYIVKEINSLLYSMG